MHRRISFATTVALIGALGLAVGTGASSRPAATLRADVAEWSVVPSTGVVDAGEVRILVRNLGEEPHQLMVVRTRSFAQELPLRGDRAVAVAVAAVRVAPGTQKVLDVRLRHGSYLLLDNLPWHYWKGTSAAFAVR